ncbi:unnamed protein product [Calypogeia fissa]
MAGRGAGRSAGQGAGSRRQRLSSDISPGSGLTDEKDLPESLANAQWADAISDQVQILVEASIKLAFLNTVRARSKSGHDNQKLALMMLDHSQRVGREVLQFSDFVDQYKTKASTRPPPQ